jgi:polyisoprenoid-binding protein YceI
MATWNIDPSHTSVEFTVRHMGLSTVRGRFNAFSGSITTDADGAVTAASVDIQTASIDTNNGDRDNHLRSADFFDAAAHPTITFRSTRIEAQGGGRYNIHGDLHMHGVTGAITLATEVGDVAKDPWGNTRRAASASAAIDRRAWGLTWNQILELGSLLVSERVNITLDVQAVAAG